MEDLKPGTPVVITSDASYAATGSHGIIGAHLRHGSSYPVIFPGTDSEPDWYQPEDFEVTVTDDHGVPEDDAGGQWVVTPEAEQGPLWYPWEPIPGAATVEYRDAL